MQKVHVKRYIAGKKPDWAPEQSSDEESEDENVEEEVPSDSEHIRADEIEEGWLKLLQVKFYCKQT